MNKTLFRLSCSFLIALQLTACTEKETPNNPKPPIPDLSTLTYAIDQGSILYQQKEVRYKGVNAMQTFGLNDPKLMNEWKIKIVREFIGNLREQPIVGSAIEGSDGVWYHPLQTIVDQNRANGMVTILCPFGWVDEGGNQELLTGMDPARQGFYPAYKQKMREIAQHFKSQQDVWVQVWNEPYHWDNQNGYTHNRWLNDMIDMADNLRSVSSFHSIILIPGNEQGQSEEAILSKGSQLLEGRYNILFDIHAYEKWLANSSEESVVERLNTIKNKKFAFVIGEVGVNNVGGALPVAHFLEATDYTEVSVLGWLWNQNAPYKNALLTKEGVEHATPENNYWGKVFKEFLNK